MKPCSVSDCNKPHHAHGLCSFHAWRLRRTGDPLREPPKPDFVLGIWARTDRSGDCWEWTGVRTAQGYGVWAHKLAHRRVYELLVGHLCRNRACVKPAHLEPVTHAENIRRGLTVQRNRERGEAITSCKHGHEFTPENTYRRTTGRRACRTCQREAEARRRAARRPS